MRCPRIVLIVAFVLAVAAASMEAPAALCLDPSGGFAIFHGVQAGYFEPVPAPFTREDVTPVFWQIGFGNNDLHTATSLFSDGTGISGKGIFYGNDSGSAPTSLLDGQAVHPAYFPPGSIVLQSTNWGNPLIDGCADNPRAASFDVGGYTYTGDDNLLNPYWSVSYGVPGHYTLALQTDYPMAVLLTTPGEQYFAVAAVASMNRDNDGSGANGPCALTDPGTNPAPCDFREGFFAFDDVSNGHPSFHDPSRLNVVPWQATPQPTVDSSLPVDPNDPGAGFDVNLSWPAVTFYHDQSIRPSTNPTLAPADPTAAPGVGVLDIAGTFGLVRSILEVAPASDPAFVAPIDELTCPGDPRCASSESASLFVPANHCIRLTTAFGLRPRTSVHTRDNCRLGKCGDIGYDVSSPRSCFLTNCTPSPEICDQIDNDCDGGVDEDFDTGDACTGTGQCGGGTIECSGPASTQCSTDPGGSQDQSSPEVCDDVDNDCDGSTDEDAVRIEGSATINPATLNLNAQGNQISITLDLVNTCDPGNPIPVDGSFVGDAWISHAGSITLPDPTTIPCPDASGSFLFERGIVDDTASRNFSGSDVTLRYTLSADGDCRTLDGDRQEILSLLSDTLDGSTPPICVAGRAGGIPFEACGTATVLNRGNR